MNRKGSFPLPIAILVILVFLLFGFAMFTFLTHSNNLAFLVSNYQFMDLTSQKENIAESYLNYEFSKAYFDVYMREAAAVSNSEDLANFDNSKFTEEIKSQLINNIKSEYTPSEFVSLRDYLADGNFAVTVNERGAHLTTTGFLVTRTQIAVKTSKWVKVFGFIPAGKEEELVSLVGVDSRPVLKVSLDYASSGLDSFNSIHSSYETCKENEDIVSCFNSLNKDFVLSEQQSPLTGLSIKSKRTFLVNNQEKQVVFSLNE